MASDICHASGKHPYKTAADARTEMLSLKSRKGGDAKRLQVYRCMCCNRFHFGRPARRK